MSLLTEDHKIQDLGDDSTTEFPFPLRFLKNEHLKVTTTETTGLGLDTPRFINVDYSVTGAREQDGGTVIFNVAPVTGERVTVERIVPVIQESVFEFLGTFPEDTVEDQLDYLTMIDQQTFNTLLLNCLRFPASDPITLDPTLPNQINRLGKFLRFDEVNGEPRVATIVLDPNQILVLDEDDFASCSRIGVATQGSTKVYINDQDALLQVQITANANEIIVNRGLIDQNILDITANAGQIIINRGLIDQNILDIIQNATDIGVLATAVGDNATAIDDLEAAIASGKSLVSGAAAINAQTIALAIPFTGLLADINEIEGSMVADFRYVSSSSTTTGRFHFVKTAGVWNGVIQGDTDEPGMGTSGFLQGVGALTASAVSGSPAGPPATGAITLTATITNNLITLTANTTNSSGGPIANLIGLAKIISI